VAFKPSLTYRVSPDLKETLAPASNGSDPQELRRALLQLQDVTRLMANSETIFIACVQGWAVGGGTEVYTLFTTTPLQGSNQLQFALAADLVIAGPTAKFRLPEIDHGHSPTGGLCKPSFYECGSINLM